MAEQEAQVHAEQAQHKVSCCWHKTTPASFVFGFLVYRQHRLGITCSTMYQENAQNKIRLRVLVQSQELLALQKQSMIAAHTAKETQEVKRINAEI
eukprot:COSAG06_NODE_6389_length_2954_cov_63.339054_6_plen_95_part_01